MYNQNKTPLASATDSREATTRPQRQNNYPTFCKIPVGDVNIAISLSTRFTTISYLATSYRAEIVQVMIVSLLVIVSLVTYSKSKSRLTVG